MDGISGSIASASMQLSANKVQDAIGLYTIDKAMDIESQAMSQLLGGFAQANPAPPSVNGLGGILDVSA